MIIRTIHHQAATGGTVISKCLAAQPGVCLVSEVNPNGASKVEFSPLNPLSQFIEQYPVIGRPLKDNFFRYQIEVLTNLCDEHDRQLVLRDHSHSDYMIAKPRHGSSLLAHLKEHFPHCELRSVITVRDPIDSYLSSLKKPWLDQIKKDFGRYCDRLLKFVNDHSTFEIYRYEDFCADPEATMQAMCTVFELDYDHSFLSKFSAIRLTGDSGRTSKKISQPPRRTIPEGLADAAAASPTYAMFCERFDYAMFN